MKPEKTLENKAKFFALYWAQLVMINPNSPNTKLLVRRLDQDERMEKRYLDLFPLSKITDEDAIEIVNLSETIETFPIRNERRAEYGRNNVHFLVHQTEVADYLRSRGYLLSWMGLTPDEIIEYGWAKYKED